MSKDILFEAHACAAIGRGVDTLANAMKVTPGPRGRNGVLDEPLAASLLITKDGVTQARELAGLLLTTAAMVGQHTEARAATQHRHGADS